MLNLKDYEIHHTLLTVHLITTAMRIIVVVQRLGLFIMIMNFCVVNFIISIINCMHIRTINIHIVIDKLFCYIYYNVFPEINIKYIGVIVQTCVLIFLNDSQ